MDPHPIRQTLQIPSKINRIKEKIKEVLGYLALPLQLTLALHYHILIFYPRLFVLYLRNKSPIVFAMQPERHLLLIEDLQYPCRHSLRIQLQHY